MLKMAHEQDTLQTEETGVCLNKTAINSATKSMLHYEYALLAKVPFGKVYNDAKACYDRVVLSCANLCAQKQGLHSAIAYLHGHILANIRFYVTTSYGPSN